MAIRIINKNATREFSFASDEGDPKTTIKIGHMDRLTFRAFGVEFMQWIKKRSGLGLAKIAAKLDGEDAEANEKALAEITQAFLQSPDAEKFVEESFALFSKIALADGAVRGIDNIEKGDELVCAADQETIAEVIDSLPLNMLQELGMAIIGFNKLTEPEKKKLSAPRSSGNSLASGNNALSQAKTKTSLR